MALRVNFRQDTAKGGWWFNVPYSAVFVADLKYSVGAKRRSYNPRTHEWFVEHGVLPVVTRLVRKYFRDAQLGYDGNFDSEQPTEFRRPRDWESPWERESWFKSSEDVNEWARRFAQQLDNMRADPCAVLGVPMNARWDDVKRAYRKLAQQHHPDAGGSEDRMKELNAAFDELRRRYDK